MFKKNPIIINSSTIISFFDTVASQEIFQSNDFNETWLWYKLQFILDFLKQNNKESIDNDTLLKLFNTEKHKAFFNDDSPTLMQSNALTIDNLINDEPILNSLSIVLVSSWGFFETKIKKTTTVETFTTKHFLSIADVSILSFISVGLFYLRNIFSWNITAFILIFISTFFFYHQSKKFFTKIKNYKQEKNISKKIQLITDKTDNKENNIIFLIQEIGLEPWSNEPEININLKILKNKTLHFISIYKNNTQNAHPQMLLNVEKMWKEHIPLFISKLVYNEKDKTSILKTLQSMDNVIQNHIEELFWNESIEISSKQRYWLIKETEKNI